MNEQGNVRIPHSAQNSDRCPNERGFFGTVLCAGISGDWLVLFGPLLVDSSNELPDKSADQAENPPAVVSIAANCDSSC